MKILILGLSITSSWGNGHATTFRSLGRALYSLGHSIVFVEKDVPWYRDHRDMPSPAFCRVRLYEHWETEESRVLQDARDADVVIIGSYFPDAIVAADMLLARISVPILFYDLDTPVTMAALRHAGSAKYLRPDQIPFYSAYLSFSGGPVLRELEQKYCARVAYSLYCSVDTEAHRQSQQASKFVVDLSYLGTYAEDRQTKLLQLMNAPARLLPQQQFLLAGPLYPVTDWAPNVRRIDHVPPADHASFYSSSRYTLNLTRLNMVEAGYSPSVRLFEAAACGATILSDSWPGLSTFFEPGEEVLLVNSTSDVVALLSALGEEERCSIGERARQRILHEHTSRHRAIEFERIVNEVTSRTATTTTKVHPLSASTH